jgi:hypothetical protein
MKKSKRIPLFKSIKSKFLWGFFTVFLQELVGYTLIFTTIHLLYRLLLVPLSECGDRQGLSLHQSDTVPMDQSENASGEQEGNTLQGFPKSIAGNISEVISENCLR